MHGFEILKYYSRTEIQNAMLSFAKEREVVGSSMDGTFMKRPDILVYPKDIVERVKNNIVAFHCSVEKWYNPMQLSSNLKQQDIENLRKGFDIIIDIDSRSKLEYSRIAAQVVYNFLKDLGIKPTMKFSGSRGFHLAIASEAFPENIDFKETRKMYPEIPQALIEYIRESVKDKLLEELIALEGGVASLVSSIQISELSPYNFVDLEKNWSNRHLFRMPYSLHPKNWLVSLPIKLEDLKNFDIENFKPKNVKIHANFLSNKKDEATELLLEALEWKAKQPKPKIARERVRRSSKVVPEEYFPSCIAQILKGLKDGKKRSLFTLITFLRAVNWDENKIEERIKEWNKNNDPPLSERLVSTQLKWHFRQTRKLQPPNSDLELFYKSIGIEHDPKICGKNPANDAFKLFLRQNVQKKSR